jgi:hypothetical protein
VQNREELRKIGQDKSFKKISMLREGKKYHFRRGGGGINIVFGPKSRPPGSGLFAHPPVPDASACE